MGHRPLLATSFWKEVIRPSEFASDIVEFGHKIPFHMTPVPFRINNRSSSLQNRSFVEKEIQELLDNGCISEVIDRSEFINPLHLAMRNDFIQPKFLFKSNTMQPCLANYTIPRVFELKTIVLCCRRNARFPVHSSPPRKFQKCAARFLIRPDFVTAAGCRCFDFYVKHVT